jgi:hypothetical protein
MLFIYFTALYYYWLSHMGLAFFLVTHACTYICQMNIFVLETFELEDLSHDHAIVADIKVEFKSTNLCHTSKFLLAVA